MSYPPRIQGEKMNIAYNVEVGLLTIFADQSFAQTNPNFFKILLTEEDKIPTKKIGALHKTIPICLNELYNEYLKIDYDWPLKELSNCRKINKNIEITYLCRLPYVKDCTKAGKLINIVDFMSLITDEYYVEIISGSSPQIFK